MTDRPDISLDVSVINSLNTGSDHRMIREKARINTKFRDNFHSPDQQDNCPEDKNFFRTYQIISGHERGKRPNVASELFWPGVWGQKLAMFCCSVVNSRLSWPEIGFKHCIVFPVINFKF